MIAIAYSTELRIIQSGLQYVQLEKTDKNKIYIKMMYINF